MRRTHIALIGILLSATLVTACIGRDPKTGKPAVGDRNSQSTWQTFKNDSPPAEQQSGQRSQGELEPGAAPAEPPTEPRAEPQPAAAVAAAPVAGVGGAGLGGAPAE